MSNTTNQVKKIMSSRFLSGKKSKTLSEKLKSYSLAASSLLASAFVADAQNIYTDVNPDVELGDTVPVFSGNYLLDLNNDGQVDFGLYLNFVSSNSSGNSAVNEEMYAMVTGNGIMYWTFPGSPGLSQSFEWNFHC